MKIAIATNGKYVSGHFGHCEGFTMYEVEEGNLLKKEFIQSPKHKPGLLPLFLNEKGANVIIAGGMGETAQELFKENNIEVIVGIEGICDDIIEKFIKNELKSTGSICTEHAHEGHCND
ncbi:NifB/NifX family molybdenum-iron cluster-binding protein [Clostridium sp. ZBS13]|uniref:NifB/NifX family molybdenum-iron cluster-binding protein n=1 Tax=Clostridium sp. ZBS13 TaxID=2949971 RepID=UPI002079C706|nr:NifB/NifX family molybdenum-iron cluster-binding protein [Clostridium sp. ZBS13]